MAGRALRFTLAVAPVALVVAMVASPAAAVTQQTAGPLGLTRGGWGARASGSVWAWGGNGTGQLGDGNYIDSAVPVRVHAFASAVAVAGGTEGGTLDTGYALHRNGTLQAWGAGQGGELGNGGSAASAVPVRVHGLTGVTAVSAGWADGYAVRRDGTVWSWGSNVFGQLGDGDRVDSNVPVRVTGLTHVIAVAGGYLAGSALRRDGTVWSWGLEADGHSGDGGSEFTTTPVQVRGLSHVIAIARGFGTGLALRKNGTVWTLGVPPLDGGGRGSRTPARVPGLTGIIAISTGFGTQYVLRRDGTVWAWGAGANGALGDGQGNIDSAVPVRVTGLTGITAIASSPETTAAALRRDGTVWAWGANFSGILGSAQPADSNSDVPIQIGGLKNVIRIGLTTTAGYAVVDHSQRLPRRR